MRDVVLPLRFDLYLIVPPSNLAQVFKAADMSVAISTMKRSVEKHGNGFSDDQLTPVRHDANL